MPRHQRAHPHQKIPLLAARLIFAAHLPTWHPWRRLGRPVTGRHSFFALAEPPLTMIARLTIFVTPLAAYSTPHLPPYCLQAILFCILSTHCTVRCWPLTGSVATTRAARFWFEHRVFALTGAPLSPALTENKHATYPYGLPGLPDITGRVRRLQQCRWMNISLP